MKKYKIIVTAPNNYPREFTSPSRNAKSHLRAEFGGMGGARCYVYDKTGRAVSACEYIDECGGKYIYINI